MYPSSWRMRAISAFSLDAGISTRVCLAVTALRIRVIMSAIGSVIPQSLSCGCSRAASAPPAGGLPARSADAVCGSVSAPHSASSARARPPTPGPGHLVVLPAALRHSGDVALERQLPETQAAQRELPHVRPRPPAQLAAVPMPNLELERFVLF